jgi:hypothetical protein
MDRSFIKQAEEDSNSYEWLMKDFAGVLIAIVDDWEWGPVHNGTFKAFDELNYEVLFQTHLLSTNGYWNGIYLAVIRK